MRGSARKTPATRGQRRGMADGLPCARMISIRFKGTLSARAALALRGTPGGAVPCGGAGRILVGVGRGPGMAAVGQKATLPSGGFQVHDPTRCRRRCDRASIAVAGNLPLLDDKLFQFEPR